MSYSRVEVAVDTRHSARCCGRPPLLRCNKVDAVRSARPMGKRCRHKLNILSYSDVVIMVSAYFMNNSCKKTLELLKPLDIIKRTSF